mmetsp:Transcript_54226/g.126623  ORF Transcript_54226/g.126623 Transcript_54226/m.126623 type:complete len:85 (+) Transcript_54226:8525-8779(+)
MLQMCHARGPLVTPLMCINVVTPWLPATSMIAGLGSRTRITPKGFYAGERLAMTWTFTLAAEMHIPAAATHVLAGMCSDQTPPA